MELIKEIENDFKDALVRSRDNKKFRDIKNFLGVLKTDVTKESREPSDAYIISKIKSMIKSAESTSSLSELELNILEGYLPKQLTKEEVVEIVEGIITNNPDHSMGQIMGRIKKDWGGQYDGKMVSDIVREKIK